MAASEEGLVVSVLPSCFRRRPLFTQREQGLGIGLVKVGRRCFCLRTRQVIVGDKSGKKAAWEAGPVASDSGIEVGGVFVNWQGVWRWAEDRENSILGRHFKVERPVI